MHDTVPLSDPRGDSMYSPSFRPQRRRGSMQLVLYACAQGTSWNTERVREHRNPPNTLAKRKALHSGQKKTFAIFFVTNVCYLLWSGGDFFVRLHRGKLEKKNKIHLRRLETCGGDGSSKLQISVPCCGRTCLDTYSHSGYAVQSE